MHLRPLSSGVLAVALAAGAVVSAPVIASAAEPATAADIVINEVESNGDPVGDWVELANTNNESELDISGWSIVDADPKHAPLVFPEGTVIESGGYWSIYTEGEEGFGLGGNDSVILMDGAGDAVDQTSWEGHAATTWGRIPDMTGEFAETGEPTRGGINKAAGDIDPVETSAWPFDPQTLTEVDLGGDFAKDDMSGVDFAADGTAYVVNNGTGTLYVLDYAEATAEYSISGTYTLAYPDGSRTPDAEGVTAGPDGAVYVATERNNDDKSISRPSVLRFELPAEAGAEGTINATDEYSLADLTGEIGSNGGLETIEYIPNAAGGIFAVGVESTDIVHFVQLGENGEITEVQRSESGLGGVMALDYEEATGILRVLCDEVCDGRSLEMTYDGSKFVTDGTIYARPAGMANLANEGYASTIDTIACEAGGTAERARYLWADDAGLDGISLHGALAEPGECTNDDAPDTDTPAIFGSLSDSSVERFEAIVPGFGSLAPLLAL